MALKNQYLIDLLETVKKKKCRRARIHSGSNRSFFESLQPVVEKRQDLVDAGVFEKESLSLKDRLCSAFPG